MHVLQSIMASFLCGWPGDVTCLDTYSLKWCHDERNGISNQQPDDCLLNGVFGRKSKKLQSHAYVTGVCEGIHRWPVNSPHKGSVTREIFPFGDVVMQRASSVCLACFPPPWRHEDSTPHFAVFWEQHYLYYLILQCLNACTAVNNAIFFVWLAGGHTCLDTYSLQRRHNERDGVSNHQLRDCTVYSGADKRKHQSSAPLAFVRGIHRWPVNSPHKGPVTRKMFSFDDVIIWSDKWQPTLCRIHYWCAWLALDSKNERWLK